MGRAAAGQGHRAYEPVLALPDRTGPNRRNGRNQGRRLQQISLTSPPCGEVGPAREAGSAGWGDRNKQSPSEASEGQDRHVVKQLPGPRALGQDVDQLLGAARPTRLIRQQHIFGREVRPEVEQTVRENDQRVPWVHGRLPDTEQAVWKDADRRAPYRERLLAGDAAQEPRMAVPRVYVAKLARSRIEDGMEDGHIRVVDL